MSRIDRNNLGAVRTCAEVAAILTARGQPITKAGVRGAEKRALAKLARRLADLAPPRRDPRS